jgi:SAM-dependent methyltransferase
MQAEHNSLPACPLCGNPSLRPRDQRAADCPRCGLLVNLETRALDYSEGGGQAVPDANKIGWREKNAQGRFDIIAPHLAGHEVFVDIGCGSGEMLDVVGKHFAEAFGFDTNLSLIPYLRSKGLTVFETAFRADLARDKIKGRKALFALSHVLEHLDAPLMLVREIVSAMSPGDLLYVEVPLHTGRSFSTLGYGWNLWNPEHVALYAQQSLVYLARESGLETVHQGTRVFSRASHSNKTRIGLCLERPLEFLVAATSNRRGHTLADVLIADYGCVILKKRASAASTGLDQGT